ncbi:DUF1178 family protein [Yoonia sp. 208BN28-4]|uniref:DUF1178 family protein n=1 Tax=Yoonia sp. 208BN28-4 TaxID=3126505 RepID=UPI0030AD9C5B
MIRYHLTCDNDHAFESWFQSSAAYDTLAAAGMVSCAVCGSSTVSKSLMAPTVTATKAPKAAPAPLEKLRAEIEANADDVGNRFATEARAMHLGDAPERPIYGQANGAEAKSLIEDGVPVLPLPFIPRKKAH